METEAHFGECPGGAVARVALGAALETELGRDWAWRFPFLGQLVEGRDDAGTVFPLGLLIRGGCFRCP